MAFRVAGIASTIIIAGTVAGIVLAKQKKQAPVESEYPLFI